MKSVGEIGLSRTIVILMHWTHSCAILLLEKYPSSHLISGKMYSDKWKKTIFSAILET